MRVLSFKRREGVVYARRKNLLLIASSIPQLKNVLRGVHALEKNSPRQTSVRSHLADHGLSFPTPDQLKATATPLSVYINSQLINLLATYEEGRERLIDDTTLVDFLFDTEAFGPGLITVSDKGIDASLAMNKESHLLSDIQAHEALGQFASLQTNAHFISSVVRLKDSGAAVNRYLTSMRQLLRIVREDEFDDFYNFFQTQFGLSVDEVVQELDEAAVVVRTPTDPSDLRNPEQFMQNNFAVLFSFKSKEKVSEISKTVIEKIKTMDDNVVVEEDGGVTFLSIPREEVTFAISGNVLAFGVKRETCQAVLAAIAAPPATTEKPASMNVNLDVTQIVALSGGPTLLVDDWIFTAELRPDQNGLHLHLNQSIGQVIQTLSSNVPQILVGVQEAQKRARWTQSMNNMRQLVNACVMHQAESSDSSWPKTVDEAVKEWGEYGNRIKRCPVSGQAYTYLQPVITQTSKTMVLYSAARPDGTRITAYADGHTEILSTEEFEAILKKTNELREKELNEIGKDNSADDF